MSLQSERSALPSDLDPPDDSFRAAIGAYVGAVLASVATVAAVALGASTASVVGTFPTAGMIGVHAGILVAGTVDGFPLRIAVSTRRKAALFLPAAGFLALATAGAFVPAVGGGVALAATVLALLVALAAVAVVLSARARYVDALTDDDPVATGSFYPSFRYDGVRVAFPYVGVLLAAVVLVLGVVRGGAVFVFWYLPALFWLFGARAVRWTPDPASDDFSAHQLNDLAVHDAGLRVQRSEFPSLIRWDEVRGVRRTDEDLVIERRWVDVRCPLETLDDPDALEAAIEERRRSAER